MCNKIQKLAYILTSFAGVALQVLVHGAHPRVIDASEIGILLIIIDAIVVNFDH